MMSKKFSRSTVWLEKVLLSEIKRCDLYSLMAFVFFFAQKKRKAVGLNSETPSSDSSHQLATLKMTTLDS